MPVEVVFETHSLSEDNERGIATGYVATGWALAHLIGGEPLEALVAAGFDWREGWEYQLAGSPVEA